MKTAVSAVYFNLLSSNESPQHGLCPAVINTWWNNSLGGSATQPNQQCCLLLLQLDRLPLNWVAKLSSLINHSGVILHKNNTRAHAAVITRQTLVGFLFGRSYPTLPIYSPDVASTAFFVR
ncbi:hypothetical protein TNCV_855351 [Trichonephila clavipes]|nr:hypothetical protein TNCV_855351 [Trichonephila clavipes]